MQIEVKLAPKLEHVFNGPARYREAHGGRGSSKSWGFADMFVINMLQSPKEPFLAARELQNSIKDSVHKLLSDRVHALGLQWYFDIGESYFRCQNGSYVIFKGLRTNANEIKSLEGVKIAWVEEAQKVSQRSLDLLIPTIRAPGSEIWFTWNPDDEEDAVSQMFLENDPPPNTRGVEINWDDNPWFPQELEAERQHLLATDPDRYEHVWGGKYQKFAGGSIYGKLVEQMKADGRVTKVPYNPAFPVFTIWDLGFSDTLTIIFCQIVGKEPRVIDYYENNLEAISHYVSHVLSKPYNYDVHVLPHDAGHKSLRTGTTLKQQVEDLGLKKVEVLPVDAVAPGIELMRSLLPQLWVDEDKCKLLVKAWLKYQYEYDEERGIFKKTPRHDWSSHASDAGRYMATYLATRKSPIVKPATSVYVYNQGGQSWMG